MSKFIAGMKIVRRGYQGEITYTVQRVIDGDTYALINNFDLLESDAKVESVDRDYIRTFTE